MNQNIISQLNYLINPTIQIDWNASQKYCKDGCVYLQGSAASGLEPDVDTAIHELAHLIEIDDLRMTLPIGWGFKYGKWIDCIYNRQGGWYERKSKQHIEREARTWAIQYQLSQYFGIDKTVCETVNSAIYLPDFYVWYGIEDKEAIQTFAVEVENLIPSYPLEKILSELRRKQEFISSLVVC